MNIQFTTNAPGEYKLTLDGQTLEVEAAAIEFAQGEPPIMHLVTDSDTSMLADVPGLTLHIAEKSEAAAIAQMIRSLPTEVVEAAALNGLGDDLGTNSLVEGILQVVALLVEQQFQGGVDVVQHDCSDEVPGEPDGGSYFDLPSSEL